MKSGDPAIEEDTEPTSGRHRSLIDRVLSDTSLAYLLEDAADPTPRPNPGRSSERKRSQVGATEAKSKRIR